MPQCLKCHNPVEKGYGDNGSVDLCYCTKCYHNNDEAGLRKEIQDLAQALYDMTNHYENVCKRYELDTECYSCHVLFNTNDEIEAYWKCDADDPDANSRRICRACT